MVKIKCTNPKCLYEWESRKPNPKNCPKCKAFRKDWKPLKEKKIG